MKMKFPAIFIISLVILSALIGCNHSGSSTTSNIENSWFASARISQGLLTEEQLAMASWVRVEASRSNKVIAFKEAAFTAHEADLLIPDAGAVDITITGYGDSLKSVVMWSGTAAIANGSSDPGKGILVLTAGPGLNLAPPSFSPVGGAYSNAQSVNLNSTTAGTTIYYTTDGSTPTIASSVYSTVIPVSTSATIKAIAVKPGMLNSTVATSAYTISIPPVAASPTFSPAAGSYTTAQNVSLSTATVGATIYYTTDGSVPSSSSAVYSTEIPVVAGTTINAIAIKTGMTSSAMASAAYTITIPGTVTAPTFSPAAGSYTNTQSVSLSTTTSGATIYFTTDGTTPTTASSVYTDAISVSKSATINAIAVKSGFNSSGLSSAAYTITIPAPVVTPTFSPTAGNYISAQSIAISTTTPGATIYYTTDGSTPTTASTIYSTEIPVTTNATINAIAVKTGLANSAIGSAAYTISIPPAVVSPSFSPSAGSYTSAQSVSLSTTTTGATIYYTIDGSVPNTTSSVYTAAIPLSSTTTLNAIALKTGMTSSGMASATYAITIPGTVAAPAFSPLAGTYTSAQSVLLSTSTAGATIYYTTDGSTPTTASPVYSTAIPINTNATINAIAVKGGMNTSGMSSAAYTISIPVAISPSFSPAAGSYSSVQSVSLNSTTSGASIYYTLDGSIPTTSSLVYSLPIPISTTTTINAIAIKDDMTNSQISKGTYTISLPVANLTFSLASGTYRDVKSLEITTTTDAATIYYTTDGTTPTLSSSIYTGPLEIHSTATINAVGIKAGYTNSPIKSATFSMIIPSGASGFKGNATASIGNTCSLIPTGNPFTIEYWIRPDSSAYSANFELLQGPYEHRALRVNMLDPADGASNRMFGVAYPAFHPDLTNLRVANIDTLVKNEWSHVAFSFTGTEGILYQNGAVKKRITTTVNPICGNAASIDIWSNGAAIDNIRISKISRYSTTTFSPPTAYSIDASTVFLWRFDGANQSSMIDEITGAVLAGDIQFITR